MPKFSPFAAATGAMLESNQDLFYNIVIRGKFMGSFFFVCRNRSSVRFYGHFKMSKNGKNGQKWHFSTLTSCTSQQQRELGLSYNSALIVDYGEHIYIHFFKIGRSSAEYESITFFAYRFWLHFFAPKGRKNEVKIALFFRLAPEDD